MNPSRVTRSGEADNSDVERVLEDVRFVPSKGFESRLHNRLVDRLQAAERRPARPGMNLPLALRPALVLGVLVLLLCASVFLALPKARAAVLGLTARFVEVGSPSALAPQNLASSATDQHAGTGQSGPALSAIPDSRTQGGASLPSIPNVKENALKQIAPLAEPPAATPLYTSVQDAQAKLDFQIRVPARLPDGYRLLGAAPVPSLPANGPKINLPADVPVPAAAGFATLVFANDAGEKLILNETRLPVGQEAAVPLPAGKGSTRDVMIAGQPGQYIEGAWGPNGWVNDGHFQLHWQDAQGITYGLTGTHLGLEQVLAVAESVR